MARLGRSQPFRAHYGRPPAFPLGAGGTANFLSLGGSITSTGAIVKTASVGKSGSITSAGAVIKAVTHGLAGSVTSTGTVVKFITRRLLASITPSGAITAARLYLLSL